MDHSISEGWMGGWITSIAHGVLVCVGGACVDLLTPSANRSRTSVVGRDVSTTGNGLATAPRRVAAPGAVVMKCDQTSQTRRQSPVQSDANHASPSGGGSRGG